MITAYLGIAAGLAILAYAADLFINSSISIARFLNVTPLIIGLTVVGMATSAPEILVGSVAASQGKTEIALGNALGSNIANIGLVLGLTILLIPAKIRSATLKREFLIMFLTMALAWGLLLDRELSRWDAGVLLIGLVIALTAIVILARRSVPSDPLGGEFADSLPDRSGIGKTMLLLIGGLALLLLGAEVLVDCAVKIARYHGLSELVIGLTIIAVGTSLPELAASITAVNKGEADIAIGNVIGSNMFNMLAVIGVPGLIHPAVFDGIALTRDFPVMAGLALLMGWMAFIHGSGRFDRGEGAVLLLAFIIYMYSLF